MSAATPHTAIAIQLLKERRLTLPRFEIPRISSATHYLLFFDGGSRGNPGPGGAGAVVVLVTSDNAHTEVIAYGDPTTTNNQAEYNGLVTGLTVATVKNWLPLSVIGDSMLIIRQMRTYTPPLNVTLQVKYAQARRLADSLGVRNWSHHPRAAHQMADAAANLAMDTTTSSQTHHPAGHE